MFRKGPFLGLLAGLAGFGFCADPGFGADVNPRGLIDFGGGSAGVPVLSFLKLPASARDMGMGSALTTDEEATMARGNPALLSLVEDYYYSVSHAEILGEFRHENLAFTLPTAGWGAFGGSANILAATAFEDARDIDEEPSNPSAYDIALGLAYGGTLWRDRVGAGGRLDLIRSTLDGTSANGYAINGALIFMLVSDLRVAAVLNNLSHGIKYGSSPQSPTEPLPLNLGVELGKPLLGSRWSGNIGFAKGNDGLLRYYAGAEWRLIRYLVVRSGYEGSSRDRELGAWSGLSAGLGVKYDRITLDYGYKAMGPLGAYHAFTLSYSRKSHFRPRDEVLLERAQEKFRKGQYHRSLSLARAAIAANPYNFKAQALAQKLQLEIDRLDETAVTLAYTANTGGGLASAWKDGHPIGGLPRRKTKLMQLKAAQGKVFILDAGSLNVLSPAPEKEKFVFGAYARMPYDAVNLGAPEIRLVAGGLDPRLPFLSSQAPFEGAGGLVKGLKSFPLKRGGEVMVLGAIDPKAMPAKMKEAAAVEQVAEAVRRQTGPAKDRRILVLLLHASLPEAYKLAAKVPELDVIILSGEAQVLGMPMKSGKTLICSPGLGATHVGELTLQLDKDGRIRSFRHSLLPLDASVPEDEEMRKFLEPVTIDPNKFALDAYDSDFRAQVIAYVRAPEPDADGGALFLKDLRTGREYPVPVPGLHCARPILAYGRNRMAFTGEDASAAREVYAFEPGVDRLDTLTRMGGRAGAIRWILGDNAMLAAYAKDGRTELYRIDPWSREVRNLTRGRFGDIDGFDMNQIGDRLALNARDEKGATLWVTNAEMAAPVAVATDRAFLGSPRWNPAGDRLAFLAASGDGFGELRVFDFAANKLITATRESRVRSFSWSVDGKRLLYSAGVNVADINSFSLDSLSLSKVTAAPASPRNEDNPSPKMLGDREGVMFEAADGNGRRILWMDAETGREAVLADSAGYHSLQ